MRPTEREWLHWLVVNIPGNNTLKGDILATYIRPTPMVDTGKQIKIFKNDIVVLINLYNTYYYICK